HSVMPSYLRVDDFAATRIGNQFCCCIGNWTGFVADHRIACIAHHLAFFARRYAFTADGVLEARLFEGLLPVVDALYHVMPPSFEHGRIDVDNDGFAGFHQLTAKIGGPILGAWFHPPALHHIEVLLGFEWVAIILD